MRYSPPLSYKHYRLNGGVFNFSVHIYFNHDGHMHLWQDHSVIHLNNPCNSVDNFVDNNVDILWITTDFNFSGHMLFNHHGHTYQKFQPWWSHDPRYVFPRNPHKIRISPLKKQFTFCHFNRDGHIELSLFLTHFSNIKG